MRGQDSAAPDDSFTLTVLQWLTTDQAQPPALADRAVAHSFDGSTRVSVSEMASRFAGARVLASAIYNGKPGTLASDLSRQLRSIEDIAPEALAPLIVDPAKTDRANTVAGEWASTSLQAESTDTVGALVLWHADERTHSLLEGASPKPRLVLVLFRASRTADGHTLARIAFGNIGG